MKTDKSSMQQHGIIASKPDEQGTPVNGGTYGHGSGAGKPKFKTGKPGVQTGAPSRPKS